MTVEERVRSVLETHGRLGSPVAELGPDDDLFRCGLTSHASINVMLGLEDEFDVEFPERLLRKATFATVGAMVAAVEELVGADVTESV
jgi:acyl carrier protein